jgi:hypothetical protein
LPSGGSISPACAHLSLLPATEHETVPTIVHPIHRRGRAASFLGREGRGACDELLAGSIAVVLKSRGNGLT